MNSIYIGIDNGLDGALVAVSDIGIIDCLVMPTGAKAKGREVDAFAVSQWLKCYSHNVMIVLETPGKFSRGVMSLCSMWDSYGVLRSICAVNQWPHARITPQQWQKAMLPGCKKGDTKPFALSVAKRLWPAQTWTATARCSTPHSGLVDAALIAEYARRARL